MKNKYTKLLLLFCSLLMFMSFAKAEDTIGESVDYTAKCSKESTDEAKRACCQSAPDADKVSSCLQILYKKCTTLNNYEERATCCTQNFAGQEQDVCKSLSRAYCSPSDQVKLGKEASAVDIKYEPVEITPEGYDDPNSQYYSTLVYGLDIKLYNVTPDIVVTVSPSRGKTYSVDSTKRNSAGVIVLRDLDVAEMKTMKFMVTSKNGNCEGKILRTINLTIPMYNQLSNRESCLEYPSYYQCQSFVTYDIDKSNFLSELNAYAKKLEKQGIKNTSEETKNNKGTLKKSIKVISNNKWIVIGIIITIGVLITVLIIKKRRED